MEGAAEVGLVEVLDYGVGWGKDSLHGRVGENCNEVWIGLDKLGELRGIGSDEAFEKGDCLNRGSEGGSDKGHEGWKTHICFWGDW